MTSARSSVQCSRMNWAIGQGSSGGRWACSSRGKLRKSTRTSSLLQSQKLVNSSRSSSGVSRSDEKVVNEDSATLAVCPDRLRLAVFMAAFLSERSERVVGKELPGPSRGLTLVKPRVGSSPHVPYLGV